MSHFTRSDLSLLFTSPDSILAHAEILIDDFLAIGSRRPAGSAVGALRRDLPRFLGALPGRPGERVLINTAGLPCGRSVYRTPDKGEPWDSHIIRISDEQLADVMWITGGAPRLFDDDAAPWSSLENGRDYVCQLIDLKEVLAGRL